MMMMMTTTLVMKMMMMMLMTTITEEKGRCYESQKLNKATEGTAVINAVTTAIQEYQR